MTARRQAILDRLHDDDEIVFFEPEALDGAIVGLSCVQPNRPYCVVYDYAALVAAYVAEGMDEDEAVEWIGFNTLGAWLGEATPIVVERVTPEDQR